jgi:flagellar basal-body rod protein FlgG
MDRGLYIAASGMLSELTRQDQIANDLANASTPGYKGDHATQNAFGQLLIQNTENGQAIGTLGLGAQISATVTDMTQAPLKQTGQPLDLALTGQGFFRVQTQAGVRYTRDGQLVLDSTGRLQTPTGYLVLDTNGQPIKAGSATGFQVAADGTVSSNGKAIAQISVVSLTSPVKQGDTLFNGTAGARPAGTSVVQGALEGSGVNATTAMVDMLSSLRTYQSDQQAIQAIDDTLKKGIASGGV